MNRIVLYITLILLWGIIGAIIDSIKKNGVGGFLFGLFFLVQ
ncbi:MAG: hypothetical protein ACUVWP_08155 [bacterium]